MTAQSRVTGAPEGAVEAGITEQLLAASWQAAAWIADPGIGIIARDCLVDWLACAIIGAREDSSRYIAEVVIEEGGKPHSALLLRPERVSATQAALANGTASHALDYDDVNLALPGHVGVAVLPALIALGESRGATLDDVLKAFAAGYDFACRVGLLVAPGHYARGFHATGTNGALGAAVACAHLLGLSAGEVQHAVGLAATQAAGLKSMFGTMAKPLHAGLAAQTGVRSALLAAKGFVSRQDALAGAEGYVAAHGSTPNPEAALATPAGGSHLWGNIFKFHAACFSTHSTIEAVTDLARSNGLSPRQVEGIEIEAGPNCSICNIQEPADALEAKFSLRAAAAFALLGRDTSVLETFAEVSEPEVRAQITKVSVRLNAPPSLSRARVTLRVADGRSLSMDRDCGVPLADKVQQSQRVRAKFAALAGPTIGAEAAERVLHRLHDEAQGVSVATLMQDINSGGTAA